MWWQLKQTVRSALQNFGLDVTTCRRGGFPLDFDDYHIDIIKRVKPFTMTSNERLFGLIEAVRYIVSADIEGDFVECGVYKGGSMMAAALVLASERRFEKHLHLYDTFAGMTEPGDMDVDFRGRRPKSYHSWPKASLDEVQSAIYSTQYPKDKVHFVKGPVEQTLPERAPERISLLRLDTDWYQSTKHELQCLFPLLSVGGVLIVDDYGQYRGARRAVEEYVSENDLAVLLNRMDFSGRMCIRASPELARRAL